MTDFEAAWSLTRTRLIDAVKDLSAEQLNWRMHNGVLTIGELTIHVAGVEVSFSTQLMRQTPEGFDARIRAAGKDGVLNELPFPFDATEITPELVMQALDRGKALVEPLIQSPDSVRNVEIVSALGPVIDGTGAFARLAYHAGYHHGQVHIIRTAPGFPA